MTHKTINGDIVILDNIDFVGKLITGQLQDDGYTIHMKSGNNLGVYRGRDSSGLIKDRDDLIHKLELHLQKDNVNK